MRAKLLNKLKQTYPKLMMDVIDIRFGKLHENSYQRAGHIATLARGNVFLTEYITFYSVEDFKRQCARREATAWE
jgi:hypothetical protein